MMKKINIPRFLWVTCLFLELIIILVVVIDYKVNYQYLTNNSLYFYDCDGVLCVSEIKSTDEIYSVFSCGTDNCPVYQKVIEDDYAILSYGNSLTLFDYKKGKVISKGYDDYEFINSNYIIVSKNKNKGVINLNDELTVKMLYEEIGRNTSDYITGYSASNIIAKRNDIYGIISFKDGSIVEEFKYSDNEIDGLLDIIKKDSDVSV